METISNVASGVSKAIWGEQNPAQGNETAGKEPISGQQGSGTASDPYDQGNTENPTSVSKPATGSDLDTSTHDSDTTPGFSTKTGPTITSDILPSSSSKAETTNPFSSNTVDTSSKTDSNPFSSNTGSTGLSDILPSSSSKAETTNPFSSKTDSTNTFSSNTGSNTDPTDSTGLTGILSGRSSKTPADSTNPFGSNSGSNTGSTGLADILPDTHSKSSSTDPFGTKTGSTGLADDLPGQHNNTGSTAFSTQTGSSNTAETLPDTHNKTGSTDPSSTNTGSTSLPIRTIPMNPNNAATGGAPDPLENTEKTGVTSSMAGDNSTFGSSGVGSESSNPGVVPASGGTLSQKQQGADRPMDAPGDEQKEAPKGGLSQAENALKGTDDTFDAEEAIKNRDPNDHSGEPMHMHGGPQQSIPKTQEERRESKVGMPGGQEHGKEPKGTGEQWVKTSGLHVDGGDFDATKPGAGREADRLLGEKGIKRTAPGLPTPEPAASGSAEKEKVPLGEKLKNKLHIGSKDK